MIPASASSVAGTAAPPPPTDAANPADCVKQAIECGYRFLDCAEFYANEAAVGEGIKASGVPRDQLYLASKVWTTTIHAGPEAVQAQLEKTLAALQTDYIDLCACRPMASALHPVGWGARAAHAVACYDPPMRRLHPLAGAGQARGGLSAA